MITRLLLAFGFFLLVLVAASCGGLETSPTHEDAGRIDTGSTSTVTPDAGATDFGAMDAVVETDAEPVPTCAELPEHPLPANPECLDMGNCGDTIHACEGCLVRAESAICEAGECRELGADGRADVRFVLPLVADGADSFTIAVLHPIDAAGGRVTCELLTSETCELPVNLSLNTVSSQVETIVGGGQVDNVYGSELSAEAGADRIVLVRLHSLSGGRGDVLATGCIEQVTITETEIAQIAIDPR